MSRQLVFNWRVTVFAAICLAVFVQLGFWQLSRETEKQILLAERDAQLEATPISAADLGSEGELNGLRVQLEGVFTQDYWLLDNRIVDGTVGFEVLQTFDDLSGKHFLVNRGFVPMGRTRADLPVIPAVPAKVSAVARVYQPSDAQFMLSDDVAADSSVPIVQSIEVAHLAARQQKGDSLYPFLVRLEDNTAGALPRHWPDTVMMPAQHRGYAVQWFAMAFAVVLVWGFFTWRKESDRTES